MHPTEDVPGTVHLVNLARDTTEGQHAPDRSDIVLVPQPSSDPQDPLNWSRKRKFWALAMTFVYTLGVGIPTTLHYSVIADITADTGIATVDLVNGNGVMFLFLGWGCLVLQPIALTYGRRGVYLLSTLLMVPILVWTGYSSTAGDWYAHRIIIGIAGAPIESLPEISIADLFFAHERGTWMSSYVLVLFESNFIAPLIAGWLNDAIGWRWTMYFGASVGAAAFVILLFGMEETMYIRRPTDGSDHSHGADQKGRDAGDIKMASSGVDSDPSINTAPPSFIHRLKPFRLLNGRPTVRQMLTMIYRPLLIIVKLPCVAWAGFIYGINLSWYLVLNGTTSPVLSDSPYEWPAALIGCIYVGPMIGAVLGCLWGGAVADRLAIHLARRNKGIREPEQRLWMLGLAGLMSAAGLIIWGAGADAGVHFVGLAFGLGMLVFGLIVGGSIGIAYAVDCFPAISGESMASVMVIRNTVGFGFTYAITPWYTTMGLQNCFITAGFVSIACMSTFLLFVWKGKQFRRSSADTYYVYAANSVMGAH